MPPEYVLCALHAPPTFTATLEAEYLRRQLLGNRPLIRGASLLGLMLTILRVVDQLLGASIGAILAVQLACVLAGSLTLAVLAFRPSLERAYLPWAELIVPARNIVVAAHVARAASAGELDVLMILPMMMIAPLFFLGLRIRAALLSGAAVLVSFLLAAVLCGLPRSVFTHAAVLLGLTFIGCVIAGLRLERASRREFLEQNRVLEFAERDALTGTANRRVLDERLEQMWQSAIAEQCALAVMIIDVDHFKAYNDRHGHLAGDEALRRIAATLQPLVRPGTDILARYGGEEFAAVLYDLRTERAERLAEQMRRGVKALALVPPLAGAAGVTISIGLAVIRPVAGRSCRGALQLADQALYEAKLQGRDRVVRVDDVQYQLIVTGVFPATIVAESATTAR